MPYARQTLTALRAQALTDIQAASFNANGAALLQKSILRILGTVTAGMTYELYAFLDWISLQAVPFTATDEFLNAWAALKGVTRIPATVATGVATFTGIASTDLPQGTLLSRGDGVQYSTNIDWQIGSGTPLTITAVVAGSNGNASSGIPLSLSTPIVGITSTGSATAVIVGGADQELDDALRARMLAVYAAPPNGGSLNDYVTWALQVPGCTRAWAIPQGVGLGSVLIYCMFDVAESAFSGFPQGSTGGATLETRYTVSTGDQLLVSNWIYPLRPVTSLVVVAAPTAQTVNFTIQALSPTSTALHASIATALQDCFVRLGSAAGNSIYPSDTNSTIESVAGVGVYTLVSPVVPIVVPVGFLPVLGTITWT